MGRALEAQSGVNSLGLICQSYTVGFQLKFHLKEFLHLGGMHSFLKASISDNPSHVKRHKSTLSLFASLVQFVTPGL